MSLADPAKVTFTPTVQYLPFRLAGVVQCYIKSNPQLQYVTWTKDKRLLEPYQMKDIVVMANGSLLFTRVNEDHQGRYTCTPYNAQGTQGDSGVMEVLVRKPPAFTVEPETLYQRKVGDSVEMHCDAIEAEGTERPTIKWQRQEGEQLADSQRNRVKISGGNITIENLRREDFGYYQCVVSNEVATLMAVTQLVIEGTQPHAPYNITGKATESSITLQWLPGYSGGSEYKQDYTIWYREAGVNDWQTISVTPSGSTQVTINGLASGTSYEFQVVGRNVLGDGMMSKVMTVRTLGECLSCISCSIQLLFAFTPVLLLSFGWFSLSLSYYFATFRGRFPAVVKMLLSIFLSTFCHLKLLHSVVLKEKKSGLALT